MVFRKGWVIAALQQLPSSGFFFFLRFLFAVSVLRMPSGQIRATCTAFRFPAELYRILDGVNQILTRCRRIPGGHWREELPAITCNKILIVRTRSSEPFSQTNHS